MVWVVGHPQVANGEVRQVFDLVCGLTSRDVLLTWEHSDVVGHRRNGHIEMDPALT